MSQTKKPYNPKEIENKIYKKWLDSGYFNPDKLPFGKTKKRFTILLPPPNITGSLHMGHALNATISDILVRQQRMQGLLTAWLPGIDHAGIATQRIVEKDLAKMGVSRFKLGRKKFVEKVWQWKKEYGDIIFDQLKKLGVSCDWSRVRFTMDSLYSQDVLKAFLHYHKKGLIYRGLRTINLCLRCQTSLSDLEVEHQEENATLYYIKYGPLQVATVRPETKFGDAALAVNPKDKRYKKYVGKELEIESLDTKGSLAKPQKTKIKIKVVADDAVDPNFGTGVVKVTPAHDILDFEISQRHKGISLKQVIDERGRMNEQAGKYAGMKVEEARKKIAEDLKKVGLLVKEIPYQHNTAVCYRCHFVIEPLPSQQWFLKMTGLAKKSVQAVRKKQTVIIPKNFNKGYFSWLANTRDWCISRQLWWGHQLPVYFCRKNEEKFIISLEKPRRCPFCQKCQLEQSSDVLDTWFSSALWPFAGLSKKDLKKFYPSSILITAKDIINLWVGRMIFSGLEFLKKTPFPVTLIHATILTKEGKRMSKSLGTGTDPLFLIENFGADATRFGIIWQTMGNQEVHWDETAVTAGKKFANKIWNANRFVLSQIKKPSLKLPLVKPKTTKAFTKKILRQLEKTRKKTERDLTDYRFGQALHKLYDFFWHNYCDVCLEIAKKNPGKETTTVLLYVLLETIKMLHPFMPFITEEIYQKLPLRNKKMLMTEKW